MLSSLISTAPFLSNIHRTSRRAIILFSVVLVFLRLWYVYHLRVDQDEPQHLHTIWAIGSGQLLYREVFDNHMPLFHFLCTPLMQWIGERSDIVMVMRLAVVPLFFAMLALVYAITYALYDDKATASWAALITGLFPVFLFTGTEFRPDQFWVLLWLGALLVLIRGRLNAVRCFSAGLLLGLAFAVSMKTVLMVASLLVGAVISWFYVRHKPGFQTIFRLASALVAGMTVAPAAILVWFAAHGQLASFWYCVMEHNVRYAHQASNLAWIRAFVFPAGLLLILWRSRVMFRFSDSPETEIRRIFIVASGGIYFSILFAFWPVLNNETYLPGLAILTPPIAAFLTSLRRMTCWPVMFATMELLMVLIARPLRMSVPTTENKLVGQILALTKQDEYVMDETGESIFRKRPCYLLMETLTRDAMKRGVLTDTIPDDIAATGTTVVVRQGQYSPKTHAFLDDNFLPLGSLLVAGREIRIDPAVSSSVDCAIAVPAKYALYSLNGELDVTLDGIPYTAPRFLGVGHHQIVNNGKKVILIAVWERALQHGFIYPPDD